MIANVYKQPVGVNITVRPTNFNIATVQVTTFRHCPLLPNIYNGLNARKLAFGVSNNKGVDQPDKRLCYSLIGK